ncbi:MAG: PIN domain-containing protein [Euryarchaeota archaeon]|nr:PIN domain-containing protein [Euryarchaeota archaeon]
MSILFDTAVLHGFLNTRDARHEDAKRIVEAALEGRYGTVFTTTFILDEALSLARARREPYTTAEHLLGMVGLRPDVGLAPFITLLDIGLEDVAAATRIQERHWDRGLRFTDCTSLHVVERDGLDAVATFDAAFAGVVKVVDAAGP